MRPDDLDGLTRPIAPDVHPLSERVAWVRERIDVEADRYHRTIWVGDAESHTQFTSGPGDSAPRWSPDGGRLMFLRLVDDIPQVAVMPADGGEAEVISSFELGVREAHWSPDGSRIAVVATDWTAEWKDLTDEERARRPRRITSLPYRYDDVGQLHDRRRQIHLLDPAGDRDPQCLTPGEHEAASPTWHPDGASIAFLSDQRPDPSVDFGSQVYAVDVRSGEVTRIVDHGGWTLVRYSPAGSLHLLGRPDPHWPHVSSLWRLDPHGVTALTEHLDRSAASLAGGTPFIEFDGALAYVQHEDSGSIGVVAVHGDGTVDHVVAGRQVVSWFSVSAGRIAYVASTATDPGTLFTVRDGEGEAVDHSSRLDLVEPEHFRTISDGVEIDVWVYLPDGSDDVPVLLNIHGGPSSQYGFGFFDEFQVYAAAGFGVVACNPRGSSGRGLDHVQAVTGDGWGSVDVADVNAALNAALDRVPRLDSERLGIMGGSYGGFLTAWIIADDHRWRSAVVERALLSFPSFAGTSDIGGSFPRSYTGADFPDGWDVWWSKSPLRTAASTATPTLILHAELDFRCPIEQAEQYFATLLRAGVETEFVRIPAEGHEMSRTGKPRHRVERFEAILDWHDRHLR